MIVGIIGTGTIGEMLIEAFIESEALKPEQLIIYNRNLHKARAIANKHRRIKVALNNPDLVQKADLIIICVKPKEVYSVLKIIAPNLTEKKCLVSVTSPVSVAQLESLVNCSVARFIPSITNRALQGATLYSIGNNCSTSWRKNLLHLFNRISTPIEINNEQTRISADIVSCGPAFFSFLAQQFITSAVHTLKIDKQQATTFTEEMLIGFGELLKKKYYSLETLQNKVTVPNGITGIGINILEDKIGNTFGDLFTATNKKFLEDVDYIEKQFESPY